MGGKSEEARQLKKQSGEEMKSLMKQMKRHTFKAEDMKRGNHLNR